MQSIYKVGEISFSKSRAMNTFSIAAGRACVSANVQRLEIIKIGTYVDQAFAKVCPADGCQITILVAQKSCLRLSL
jgi:hypothetical protein